MKFEKGDKVVVVSLNEIEKDTYYSIGDYGVIADDGGDEFNAYFVNFNDSRNTKVVMDGHWYIIGDQLKLAEDQPQQIDPVFLKKIISELLDLQQETFKMVQRQGVNVSQEVLFKWNSLNSLIREKVLGE